jgi:hypothetical protein
MCHFLKYDQNFEDMVMNLFFMGKELKPTIMLGRRQSIAHAGQGVP